MRVPKFAARELRKISTPRSTTLRPLCFAPLEVFTFPHYGGKR